VLDLNITNWKIDCQHAYRKQVEKGTNYGTGDRSQFIPSASGMTCLSLACPAKLTRAKTGLSCIARQSDAGSFSGLIWQQNLNIEDYQNLLKI
jgi:hypothetical protein